MDYKEKIERERQAIADMVVQHIESGALEWSRGWHTVERFPMNAKTGRQYNGTNFFVLHLTAFKKGYGDPRWLTFNQAQELGVKIKAGEKATTVFHWNEYDKKTKKAPDWKELNKLPPAELKSYRDENIKYSISYHNVFNAAQVEGLPELKVEPMSEEEQTRQNELIERVIANSAAPIYYNGKGKAFYIPLTDSIHLPAIEDFKSMQDYYATALHEIAHSTGHESRLSRDLLSNSDAEYAREELRAELSSVFLQAELGISIDGAHIQNHSAYIQGYLSEIKSDKDALFKAIKDAGEIANYVKENYATSDNVKQDESMDSVKKNDEAKITGAVIAGENERENTQKSDKILSQTAIANTQEPKTASKSTYVPYQKVNLERLNNLEKNVPEEMKVLSQWCPYKIYRNKETDRFEKIVLNAKDGHRAKSNDPETWTSFSDALEYARKNNCAGLAFALNKNTISCIDLDKCITDGNPNASAARLLEQLSNTYTEKSVSGEGVHIFLKDNLLQDKFKNRANLEAGQEIEVYDSSRFISMTGDLLSETNSLGSCSAELKTDLQKILGEKEPTIKREYGSSNKSDRDVIERIRKSKKGADFELLYRGGSKFYKADGSPDNSKNDLSLLNTLAFFTDCDPVQMERIFRSSGLYREGKDAYLKHSINRSIETLKQRPTNINKRPATVAQRGSRYGAKS